MFRHSMAIPPCTVYYNLTEHLCVAPGFPVQTFPNGYPGYPISAESSQPSLTDDHRHSLMGMDDQVRPTHTLHRTDTRTHTQPQRRMGNEYRITYIKVSS